MIWLKNADNLSRFPGSPFHTCLNILSPDDSIHYGIFSFEEETEEVRELLKMGCERGAEVLLATF